MSKRDHVASSLALTVGSIVNGVVAYAYVSLGTRTYGAEAFAPIAVLWTFWAIATATLTFPIQHWAIRTITAEETTATVRGSWKILSVATGLVSLVLGGVAWWFGESLFGQTGTAYPAIVVGIVIGSAYLGLVRGLLAGQTRFVAAGTLIGAENVSRFLAGFLAVALGWSVVAFAAALMIAPIAATPWMRLGAPSRRSVDLRAITFLGGLAGAVLIAQILLNAGPAVLSAIGGSAAATTAFFSALALFRAPYLVALGLTTQITGPFTKLSIERDVSKLDRVLRSIVTFTAAAAIVAYVFGRTAGPSIVSFIFGSDVVVSATHAAWISAGATMALAALILTLLLIGHGAFGEAALLWFGALLLAIVPLLGSTSPADRTVAAFRLGLGWVGAEL